MGDQPLQPLQLPPFLKQGDLVCVISPSGALKGQDAIAQGLDIWRSQGYNVQLMPHVYQRFGYLAGEDELRRSALAQAWQDPHCRAIVCSRGGYGSMRLLEHWTWQTGNQPPKWLIGFSDITALLWSLGKAGISGLHAPVLTTLPQEPEDSSQRLFKYLQGQPLPPLEGQGWGGGQAEGLLFPANLTVATQILHTPLQPNLNGVILALEDVGESPYRLDRMITQWRLSGLFEQIQGIALGRFSQCTPPQTGESWTATEVLCDRFSDLGIPIVSRLPFGHDGANYCLPVGQPVILDGDSGLLQFKI